MTFENLVLVVGGTLTGLLAGLLYAFHVAFVPALRSLKAIQHIAAVKAINRKIENPVFFLSFFGPTFLLPLAAYLHRDTSQFPLLVLASALHLIGANGVTMVKHLPLNRELDQMNTSQMTEAEAERVRTEFQGTGSTWMRLHTVRTLAAVGATALMFIACLSKGISR